MTARSDPRQQPSTPTDVGAAVRLCLLLGRSLFEFGATAQRIHDSVARLARHLGFEAGMLVSYDALLLTLSDGAGSRTEIDSSRQSAGVDLIGLARVSHLLRCLGPLDAATIEERLRAIRDAPPSLGLASRTVAAGSAGTAFCILNGGDPASWIASFAGSAFIFAIRRPIAARNFNVHSATFAVAFAGCLLAAVVAFLTRSTTPAVARIAPLLFLVPGVPLINGGIDVVRNHVTIGIARVGYTVAVLVGLGIGLGLSLRLFPAEMGTPYALSGARQIALLAVAGALGAGAIACLSNGDGAVTVLCALGGLIGRVVRAVAALAGLDVLSATLAAAVSSTVVVGWIADRRRWPSVVISVISALPMVPGYFAIWGLRSLLSFAAAKTPSASELSSALQAVALAVFISLALVIGVIGPVTILQRNTERV
jgi:uncharacterized membrane protein YjjP (DUF1212 family)